ncbi:MAG: polysaccharide deacetylase, partial [Acetatifactor sp.]|nr:polysaccharide deacetylase [Acetatifactor sp.]
DIWYATNMEIYTYVNATRQQEFSADGMTMYNPTAVSVWVKTEEGFLEVKPGETKFIGEI